MYLPFCAVLGVLVQQLFISLSMSRSLIYSLSFITFSSSPLITIKLPFKAHTEPPGIKHDQKRGTLNKHLQFLGVIGLIYQRYKLDFSAPRI
jgi:hypothetical protein